MRNLARFAAAIASVALVSTSASAQTSGGSTLEFGLDAALAFNLMDGNHLNTLDVPNSIFRVGFHRNPTWSIEPFGQISYASTEGGSASQLILGTGLLYHLSPSRVENQWYARPFIALDHQSANPDVGPDVSVNQLQLGGGFGLKMPLRDRLGARFEFSLARALESGNVPGRTIIGLQAGMSYFTR